MHGTGSTNDPVAWTPTTSSLTALPSTPFAIAMPDEFSDATDNHKQQEEPDFNKSNDAIGEYRASECPEMAQQPNRGPEL